MEIDLGRSAGDQDLVLIFIKVLPGFQWVIRRPARSSTIRGIRPVHCGLPAGNAARNRARDLEFTSGNRELGTQEEAPRQNRWAKDVLRNAFIAFGVPAGCAETSGHGPASPSMLSAFPLSP